MELISRRSAIMALTKQMSDWNDDRNKIVEQCIGAIRGLKVHDSKERKTGKWEYRNMLRICSECGGITGEKDDFNDWLPDKYCPNCGAKMEVNE